MSDEDMVGWC